jgi:hypothetical protein
MRIRFAGTSATIEVPESADFLTALRAAAIDWPFAEAREDARPLVSVTRRGDGYSLSAQGGQAMEASAVGAACSVVVDAVKAYIDEHPSRLCFHCGAVRMGGRLVMFPNQYRAGKSTLVARLAAGGHEVFGDDVLPLSRDDDRGLAIGLAPRLRLPLPANVSDAFRHFVTACAGPSDDRYLYLRLPKGTLAPRHTTAPLGAVVLLDRRRRGPASLSAASRSAALQALITRNFSRAERAGDLLARLRRLMDRLPRFTLHYSDLDEAAALLDATFGVWPPRVGALQNRDPAPPVEDEWRDEPPITGRSAAARLRQNPAVRLHEVDGDIFLADAKGTAIHQLNPLGAAVWRLLAEAASEADAVEVLHRAFPAVDRRVIERDLATLFDAFAAGGFTVEVASSAHCAGNCIPS